MPHILHSLSCAIISCTPSISSHSFNFDIFTCSFITLSRRLISLSRVDFPIFFKPCMIPSAARHRVPIFLSGRQSCCRLLYDDPHKQFIKQNRTLINRALLLLSGNSCFFNYSAPRRLEEISQSCLYHAFCRFITGLISRATVQRSTSACSAQSLANLT